jgi:hypothetical protein
VVETGKRVTKAARTIESQVIGRILTEGRAADSFGVVTARGPKNELRPGTSREELLKMGAELAEDPKGSGTGPAMLDALEEAAEWLQPSRNGDAIVVLSMGIEFEEARTSFKKVRDGLTSAGIRVFGFQLGMIIGETVYTGLAGLPGGPGFIPRAYVAPNEESLNALSFSSGGFLFIEVTDSEKGYKLSDERLAALKKGGEQIYKAIQEYYVLQIANPPKDFQADVSPEVKEKLSQVRVSYPRMKKYCQRGNEDNGATHGHQ